MLVKPRLKIASVALAGALAVSAAAPAGAVSDAERRMRRLINQERTSRGISRLKLINSLSRKARRHSKRMAAKGRVVYHSNLSYTMRSYSYTTAGENVGMSWKLKRVHRMFMRSRSHRGNILRRAFKNVGVGVYRTSGRVWVTEIFYG
jgi:uncharacterized protein YkwD